ncbi:MAG: murein biosynthesis integral membrane protein MurJ [Oxalobacter sp.]|nr:MAG: murein biosynthesis integral membrane protein MurJ [Oxalobacter sp.]
MNLLKTLATISGLTMLSRITGLIREFLIARAFGASVFTDAFFVAFRIPNLLRRLFAEGAFSQAFVPILAEYKNQQGEKAARTLIDHVASALVWVLLLTCVVGIVGASWVVYAIATGLKSDPQAFSAAVWMTRVMFPYILFMSLVALSGGVLNTWREFKIPAFTPVLLNLSFIVAALFLAPRMAQPVYALAIAVLIGGMLQLGIQLPALAKIGMLPRFTVNPLVPFRDAGVQRVLKQMLPATFAVSVAQISLMINTNIASRLDQGSVSWLSYADRLMEFPSALLGVALGTILLPSLSKANADGDMEEYSSLLDWGLRLTFMLALPAAVMLLTIATPLTSVLFHYGKFNAHDVQMTSNAVVAYGVGLIGLILVRILAPGYYAKQDIKTPVKIAVGVLIATQLMNLLFVPLIDHAGLSLAIGLGACINAGFLFWGLRRRGIYRPLPGWELFLVKLGGALFLLAGVSLWVGGLFDWMALQSAPMKRVGAVCVLLIACGVAYFGALLVMGFRLKDFKRTVS